MMAMPHTNTRTSDDECKDSGGSESMLLEKMQTLSFDDSRTLAGDEFSRAPTINVGTMHRVHCELTKKLSAELRVSSPNVIVEPPEEGVCAFQVRLKTTCQQFDSVCVYIVAESPAYRPHIQTELQDKCGKKVLALNHDSCAPRYFQVGEVKDGLEELCELCRGL